MPTDSSPLEAASDVLPPSLPAPRRYHGLTARSAALTAVFARIEALRGSSAPVLVLGEAGTGRELVARAVHATSPRRRGPFVTLHCAAIPEGLADSELFGHAAGAFPGASRHHVGRLEAAAGGTLYLADVGALPPAPQERLLEVVGRLWFRRLGDTVRRPFEVRLVASDREPAPPPGERGLSSPLHRWLRQNLLRLPALRYRPEDVEPLAASFLARVSLRDGVEWKLCAETLGVLLRHRWPGNARELESSLEHACAVGTPPWLQPEDLPADLLFDASELDPSVLRAEEGADLPSNPEETAQRPSRRTEPDAATLRAALRAHGGRRRDTADALGVEHRWLWRRLQELGWLR